MATVPFYASLVIPAGTADLTPATVEVVVAPGRVKLVRLYVPPGPQGEVKLWLLHQTRQLLPVPPGVYQWFDDHIIEAAIDYPAPANETLFTLCGSSPTANFSHRVDMEISIETDESQAAPASSAGLLSSLADLLGL